MELVINFSGGKDSCAMLAMICWQYPLVKKHVVFADTGWEHPGAEEWCRKIVAMFNLPLHVVRNPNKTFLSMVERRGKFPGMQQRQCTSDLKRGPIQTWIRNNVKDPVVVNCMGLRAEESPARKKKKRLARNNMTNTRRTVWDWLPIHQWSEKQVLEYLDKFSIPLHPVYSYLKRFSCRVCIYNSAEDLTKIADNDPEAIRIIGALEKKTGFTMFQQGAIEQQIHQRLPASGNQRRSNDKTNGEQKHRR